MVEILLLTPGKDAATKLYTLESLDFVRAHIKMAMDGDCRFAAINTFNDNGTVYMSTDILTSFIVIVREIEEISKKQVVL